MATPTIQWDIHWDELREKAFLASTENGVLITAQWGEKKVVVKTFGYEDYDERAPRAFLREVSVMETCKQCPQIIQLFGTIRVGGFAYVMEYMNRGPLHTILADQSRVLGWPMKHQIAIQAGQGLAYLHGCSILHGDVKSPNILVDDKDNVKICDFGFSITKNHRPTGFRHTLRWVQPERIINNKSVYTEACDVFSYGLVMWEIASRKMPHPDAKTKRDIELKLLNRVHDPLPEDCPPEYRKWTDCSRAFDPKDRPSVKTVYQALENANYKEGSYDIL